MTLSANNQKILAERLALFDAAPGIRVGDAIRFPDGRVERASHVWEGDARAASVQTTELTRGSWYLGKGYCSFSGSLNPGIPCADIHATAEVLEGARVWFFSDNYVRAHNAVEAFIPVRVFEYRPGAKK